MNREEALELAREVESGKVRSYVSAAIALSKHLIESEARSSRPSMRVAASTPVAAGERDASGR